MPTTAHFFFLIMLLLRKYCSLIHVELIKLVFFKSYHFNECICFFYLILHTFINKNTFITGSCGDILVKRRLKLNFSANKSTYFFLISFWHTMLTRESERRELQPPSVRAVSGRPCTVCWPCMANTLLDEMKIIGRKPLWTNLFSLPEYLMVQAFFRGVRKREPSDSVFPHYSQPGFLAGPLLSESDYFTTEAWLSGQSWSSWGWAGP